MSVPQHYVYLHRRETDGAIFYVGKGKKGRAWSAKSRNQHWLFVQRKHGYSVQIIKGGMNETCALALERILISRIGRPPLVNVVDGGGGTAGWRHSEETRKRIGVFNKGKKSSQKALDALDAFRFQERTETWRANMSASAKARTDNRSRSAETRAKIAASHIGIRPSPDTLQKMREAQSGKTGALNSSYDHTIRRFEHSQYGVFVGTRGELIAAYRLGSSCMSALIRGRQKTVKGWRLLCLT